MGADMTRKDKGDKARVEREVEPGMGRMIANLDLD